MNQLFYYRQLFYPVAVHPVYNLYASPGWVAWMPPIVAERMATGALGHILLHKNYSGVDEQDVWAMTSYSEIP